MQLSEHTKPAAEDIHLKYVNSNKANRNLSSETWKFDLKWEKNVRET